MEYEYRGYRLLLDFTDIWSAKIFPPQATKPYGVVVRANEAEGHSSAQPRAKIGRCPNKNPALRQGCGSHGRSVHQLTRCIDDLMQAFRRIGTSAAAMIRNSPPLRADGGPLLKP